MIRCPCGREHADVSALKKIGWQDLFGGGEHALLVNCPPPCNSTIAAAIVSDAARCTDCHRLVTGTVEDPKVHDPVGGTRCLACARRAAIFTPVSMTFRRWVETRDPEALFAWRAACGSRVLAA
jgi:hypothetical protein